MKMYLAQLLYSVLLPEATVKIPGNSETEETIEFIETCVPVFIVIEINVRVTLE